MQSYTTATRAVHQSGRCLKCIYRLLRCWKAKTPRLLMATVRRHGLNSNCPFPRTHMRRSAGERPPAPPDLSPFAVDYSWHVALWLCFMYSQCHYYTTLLAAQNAPSFAFTLLFGLRVGSGIGRSNTGLRPLRAVGARESGVLCIAASATPSPPQ